jgi:hypothetical protein
MIAPVAIKIALLYQNGASHAMIKNNEHKGTAI